MTLWVECVKVVGLLALNWCFVPPLLDLAEQKGREFRARSIEEADDAGADP